MIGNKLESIKSNEAEQYPLYSIEYALLYGMISVARMSAFTRQLLLDFEQLIYLFDYLGPVLYLNHNMHSQIFLKSNLLFASQYSGRFPLCIKTVCQTIKVSQSPDFCKRSEKNVILAHFLQLSIGEYRKIMFAIIQVSCACIETVIFGMDYPHGVLIQLCKSLEGGFSSALK